MSGFDFDDALNSETKKLDGALSKYDRHARTNPPVSWSAAVSRKEFQDDTGIRDYAAPKEAAPIAPGDEAVAQGPALPFRLKRLLYLPEKMGADPMFVIGGMHNEDGQHSIRLPGVPVP